MVDILQIEVKKPSPILSNTWQDKFAVPSFPVLLKHKLFATNLSTLNLPAIDALTLARADGDCDTSEHKHGCRNKFMARSKEFHAPNIRLPSPAPPQLSRQLKHETRVCAAN